jgi:hypothetical protein
MLASRLFFSSLGTGVVALVALAEGCGPPSLGDFAPTLAGAYCDALQNCCNVQKFTYDEHSCKAQLTRDFQTQADIVKRGRTDYVASAVGACKDAIAARMKMCTPDGGMLPDGGIDPITDACFKVFKGTVAPGGECFNSVECQRDSPKDVVQCRVDTRMGADPKKTVCFKITRTLQPNDTCQQTPPAGSFEVRDCDPSLAYCDTTGSMTPGTGTCKAYAKVGEMCVTTMPISFRACVQGAYCDVAMTMTCLALPTTGQRCTTTNQCAQGNYCDRTDPMNPTCAALKSEGAACMNGNECASFVCDRPGGAPTGTCAPAMSASAQPYEVTPRSCGFGPEATGPIEGGIEKNQSVQQGPIQTEPVPSDNRYGVDVAKLFTPQ